MDNVATEVKANEQSIPFWRTFGKAGFVAIPASPSLVQPIEDFKEVVGTELTLESIVGESLKAGLKVLARGFISTLETELKKGSRIRHSIGNTAEQVYSYQQGMYSKIKVFEDFIKTVPE